MARVLNRLEKTRALSCFGAYDMAGNVREWCWNETQVGRYIRGGGWDDASLFISADGVSFLLLTVPLKTDFAVLNILIKKKFL